MPFQPDQPKSGFVPDEPAAQSGFVPDAEEQRVPAMSPLQALFNPGQAMQRVKEQYGDLRKQGPPTAEQLENGKTPIEGDVPFALPAASVPAGVAKLVGYLNRDGAARTGLSAAVGGAKGAWDAEPGQRGDGFVRGAAKGGLMGLGAEALGAAFSGLGRAKDTITQALQMKNGDPALIDTVKGRLGQAVDSLRGGDALSARDAALSGKSVTVDPRELLGHHPDVDQMVNSAISEQHQYGGLPRSIELPASDANEIRGKLDSLRSWNNHGGVTMTPAEAKGAEAAGRAANSLRDQLHGLGDDVSDSLGRYSDALQGAKDITRTKRPINFLSSAAPDQATKLGRIEEMSGVPLQDLGSTLRSARQMANHPSATKLFSEPLFQAAKGGVKSLTAPSLPAGAADVALPKLKKALFGE